MNVKKENYYDARGLNLTLSAQELKEIYKCKPYLNTIAFIFDWALILGAIYLCKMFFNPIIYFLTVVLIGARMHALAILMHESAHYRYFKSKKISDFISNIFMTFPLFTTVESYRDNHLRHHQFLNTEDDPDWMAKKDRYDFRYPQTKWDFIKRTFLFMIGYQGLIESYIILKRLNKNNAPIITRVSRWIFNISLLVALTYFHLWKDFFLYWIVPFFTVFMFVQYIRSFSEHFGGLTYSNLYTSTRSVTPPFLETFLISPYNICYHLEHHLYPAVPYYHLPRLKELLIKQKDYAAQAHVTKGYLIGFITEACSKKTN